jgi:hypothetical protein
MATSRRPAPVPGTAALRRNPAIRAALRGPGGLEKASNLADRVGSTPVCQSAAAEPFVVIAMAGSINLVRLPGIAGDEQHQRANHSGSAVPQAVDRLSLLGKVELRVITQNGWKLDRSVMMSRLRRP